MKKTNEKENVMEERQYGVVLAGGGTKGAYQVGAWKALTEMKIKIKGVCGASIGAINGAFFLQNNIQLAQELYNNIKITDIMQVDEGVNPDKNIFNITNITKIAKDYTQQKGLSNKPLRETIEKYIDIDKIYNSKIDFGLLTVNAKDMSPVKLFKNEIKKEEMVDYLLASACFPIFKPQKIGENEYLDGGLYDNIPINMLLEKNYKNIIVLDVAGIGVKRKMLEKDVYLKIISPNEDLGGTFEFNPEKIKSNIQLGYLDTLRAFNKVQGHIYYFDVTEFNKMIEIYGLQTIYGLEYAAQIYGINKYKIYTMEEFIKELNQKHEQAQEKYDEIKTVLNSKKIIELKGQIKTILDKGLIICFATDLYLDKPMSKKFKYLEKTTKNYMESVKALLTL